MLLSLYIHIPWCMKKCCYCDFPTTTLHNKVPNKEYISHLLIDLKQSLLLIDGYSLKTIFIGGGTPSLLTIEMLEKLIDSIYKMVPLATNLELTIEVNPGTINENHLISYQTIGINRISIGVQTFNRNHLIHLGRLHRPEDATNIVSFASAIKFNSINLDIMYGLPNQTVNQALDDLRQAIALAPQHISWYQLTIEPNTIFWNTKPKLPKDDIIWDIYQQGNELLMSSGYQPYEISAYAHNKSYQCLHNMNYWRFGDYLGIGCSAHSKLTLPDGTIIRMVKVRNPFLYMKGKYLDKSYQVALSDLPFEYFMNRFRLFEIVPRNEFTQLTSLAENDIRSMLDQSINLGYISEYNKYWQITEKGKLFLNNLLELFLA
nr:radical SAM family heme chaperone HemW [Candidatus Baumannia cicadellinicola]